MAKAAFGNDDIDKAYMGQSPVSRLYMGSSIFYSLVTSGPTFIAEVHAARESLRDPILLRVPQVQTGDLILLSAVVASGSKTFTVEGLEFQAPVSSSRTGITSQLFSRIAQTDDTDASIIIDLDVELVFAVQLIVLRGVSGLAEVKSANAASGSTVITTPDFVKSPGTIPVQMIAVSRSSAVDSDFSPPSGITEIASFNPTAQRVTGISWGIGAENQDVGSQWTNPDGFIQTGWTLTLTLPSQSVSLPSPTTLPVYDIFTRYANDTVPSLTAGGYPWGQFSGPGHVTDGYYDSVPGTGASYLEINTNGAIERFGARWKFDDVGGTRNGNGATLAIASWADGGVMANGLGRRSRAHVVVTPTNMLYYVRDVENGGSVTLIANWALTTQLSRGTEYTMDVILSGSTATVVLSTGEMRTITDARIAPRAGESFITWEPYYNNESVDSRVLIKEIWADGSNFSPGTITPPSVESDLPFVLDRQAMINSPKMVMAHYFSPFPISVDNADPANDYWHRNWNLAVPGESGTHTAYGGYSRDRPVKRAVRPESNWKYLDAKEDIRQALEVQLDGFFTNIFNTSGANQDRYFTLLDAANEMVPDGTFKIVPMVDTNGGIGSASAAAISDLLARYCYVSPVRGKKTGNSVLPTAWFDDGKFIISSYKVDGKTPDWWQDIIDDLLDQYGISASLSAVFSNYNNSANFAALAKHASLWGSGADPNIAAAYGSTMITQARSRGQKWMSPIWPQDMRPQGKLFDEARNTESLRSYWDWAIANDADFAQLCTWSDYREGGEFNKSVKRGMSLLDISSYYIHRWKTGSFPVIVKDGFYLTHRNQPLNLAQSAFRSEQTQLMSHWARPNRSSLRNEVEILSFFTASTTVTVTIGGIEQTYTAPAGMYQKLFPIALGTISVIAQRGSTVVAELTSPVTITATPYNQDMGYHTFSSFRGTPDSQGQYDYQASLS